MRVLLILLTGQAMASMDASILVVTAPSLRADLHASDAQLQLVVAMYTIVFAALVVTGARLGDLLGHRRAFLLGLGVFTAASLAGGLAPNPATLIVARGLQGAGGAPMTPQVLSMIQTELDGERRARAIGAYSMVLAVGVALGQILGGLIVGAHLLAAAWRPALLLNAPVGAVLLVGAMRTLPPTASRGGRVDLTGVGLLAAAMLALVLPLTFGRDAGWPPWVWPSLLICGVAVTAFAVAERRLSARGGLPVLNLEVLHARGIAAGIACVVLLMACYAGFLLSLTLHLQGAERFSPLHAGATFAVYAGGFAAASLTWTRSGGGARDALPAIGPVLMGGALLGIGLLANGGSWPLAGTAPLLLLAGIGHACGYSPLASRLTTAVPASQASDLSGLLITASLVGQVLGVAAFTGVYLAAAPRGSAHALAITTVALAVTLAGTAALAFRARARTERRGCRLTRRSRAGTRPSTRAAP